MTHPNLNEIHYICKEIISHKCSALIPVLLHLASTSYNSDNLDLIILISYLTRLALKLGRYLKKIGGVEKLHDRIQWRVRKYFKDFREAILEIRK